MNTLTYDLLNGTLPALSSVTGMTGPFIQNPLAVPILVTILNPQSGLSFSGGIASGSLAAALPPGASLTLDSDGPVTPTYCTMTVPGTGSLIDVVAVDPTAASTTTIPVLPAPNDIGPIPVPTASVQGATVNPKRNPVVENSTIVVPPDSARVLVGCGTTNGKVITREQYWERQGTSICLAGRETRTVSLTTTEGKQSTSSRMEDIQSSLGANVSGGWGPISASISASLSVNSSTFQQVTVTEETTTYVSHTIHNPHVEPIMYLRWQLVDVITIFDLDNTKTVMTPVGSIVSAEDPMIVMGPYWVNATPKPGKGGSEDDPGLFVYS